MTQVLILTPEPPTDNAGNETTSARWRRIFEQLGHEVSVQYEYTPDGDFDFDLLVALHAYKSHDGIETFLEHHPDRPVVVALTGTDLYKYRSDHPEVDENIERADALVTLQEAALDELDPAARSKATTVYQSVGFLESIEDVASDPPELLDDSKFEVVVGAHLRDVKDPLRTARTVRKFDDDRIRVTHVGSALGEGWEERARREDDDNPNYRWIGEVPRPEALGLIAGADLLSSTSRLEGGPNVVSEAIALGTPVVASRIPGHVGLLGEDYPGYFPVGDEDALGELIERGSGDEEFYAELVDRCARLAERFEPDRERQLWRRILADL